MPAKLTASTGFGVYIISGLGRFIPQEWFRRFRQEGWEWHQANRTFTKRGLSTINEKEATALVEEYNNRFKQAA